MLIPDQRDADFKHIFPTTIMMNVVSSDEYAQISKEIEKSLGEQKSYVPSNFIGNSPYFSNGKSTENEIKKGESVNRSPITADYLTDYSLDTLKECVSSRLKKYIQTLYRIPNELLATLKLNSWLADYRDGKTHLLAHQHESSFVNAVYYHHVNENSGGELVLYSPNAYLSYHLPTHGKIYLKPEPGMIVVFPSWMTHAVNSFSVEHDERRISISVTCGFSTEEYE